MFLLSVQGAIILHPPPAAKPGFATFRRPGVLKGPGEWFDDDQDRSR